MIACSGATTWIRITPVSFLSITEPTIAGPRQTNTQHLHVMMITGVSIHHSLPQPDSTSTIKRLNATGKTTPPKPLPTKHSAGLSINTLQLSPTMTVSKRVSTETINAMLKRQRALTSSFFFEYSIEHFN